MGEPEPGGHSPEPKSAWTYSTAPMVLIYADELGSSGSVSTGTFQMLSAGRIWQPAATGACCDPDNPFRGLGSFWGGGTLSIADKTTLARVEVPSIPHEDASGGSARISRTGSATVGPWREKLEGCVALPGFPATSLMQ